MKKIFVLVATITIVLVNCTHSVRTIESSKITTLPLAEAAYEMGAETSAKACSSEFGIFSFKREGYLATGVESPLSFSPGEIFVGVITGGFYIIAKAGLHEIGIEDTRTDVEGAAVSRALKKTEGADILLDYKTTTTREGFFFPEVCTTVSGKAATLTGPSGNTKAKK
ncbi:hypothetical protein LPTSP2_20790 [Leptospira ellinghausenii]|uniref:Lipoprotein n=1 Tax=Leptospira ellinghausenii TaxID=1917822 RepID=A0A2P2DDS4_9LEPT|nr:hypothetical protein [Leptospira ellinghausenii]GBF42789.1 hypothetical protein LPTSP2_20790 [Leptospira ellinghausenii]